MNGESLSPNTDVISKKCPKCGVEFFCQASVDCWCNKELFMGEMMPEFDDRYVECMCPRCLEEFRNTFVSDLSYE